MGFLRRSFLAALPLAGLLLSPLHAQAQTTLTLSAGLSLASLEGDDANFLGDDFESTDGLVFGAHLGFPLGDVVSFAPGVYWVQKGGQIEETGGSLSLEFDYIEVPLLVAFRVTGADRPVGVSLFLGPSVAFELSCTIEVEIGEDEASEDCDDDDERRSTDFGAVFGAGVAFPLTDRLSLVVNGGLDLGLRSLSSATDEDIKNSMWFLTAGIGFPLGG